jgi:hypothetical protein
MGFSEGLVREYQETIGKITYNEKCLERLTQGRLKLLELGEDALYAQEHDPRFYEEIECLGYNPDERMMEAIIKIKRPYGYGGGCQSHGSMEYVHFCFDRTGDGDFGD